MDPRIDVITLGVSDLERSLAFYRGLGFESPGVIGTEFEGSDTEPSGAAAMFDLGRGLILSLYALADLTKDADGGTPPAGSGAFSLGHLGATREEVDELLELAAWAGGTVTGPPHDRPWGIYSGYFRDPDGHLWEVIWNPRMLPSPAD